VCTPIRTRIDVAAGQGSAASSLCASVADSIASTVRSNTAASPSPAGREHSTTLVLDSGP
jgi:hypothetical protein